MAGRAYAWRMRVATANRERIAASLSAASRLPSACSRSRDSLIVLAANLNLRVCSLRYLFGILFGLARPAGSRSSRELLHTITRPVSTRPWLVAVTVLAVTEAVGESVELVSRNGIVPDCFNSLPTSVRVIAMAPAAKIG